MQALEKMATAGPDYEPLRELFQHHIDSFDHLVEFGLETLLMSVKPVEVVDSFTKQKLRNILSAIFTSFLSAMK